MSTDIRIDASKCDGCGKCVIACHEGVIELVGGVATVVRPGACDGIGDCLPACPHGAITLVRSSAPAAGGKWPIQLRLVNPSSASFDGADILLASDCSAFVCRSFHKDYADGRTVVIACPKLDATDHSEKLAEILGSHDVRSLTVLRMEVPCCGGLVRAAVAAMEKSGSAAKMETVTLGTDGAVKQPQSFIRL
jgi:Fe-S-cluster-containing hydrogenase component 2